MAPGARLQRDDRGVEALRRVRQHVARVLRQPLQVGVERRVDAQATAEERAVALVVRAAEQVGAVQQVVTQRLGVVRAGVLPLGDAQRALGQDEVGGQGRRLGFAEGAVVDEALEDLLEPCPAALGVVDRVVRRRRPHEAGEERRLDERQLVGGGAEVGLGGGLDAVGVVAEEDGVQVALEDGVLGVLTVEHQGVVDLQQLVPTVALEPGEEVVLDDLHGDRRGALLRRRGGEVGQRRPHEAADVDAVVAVELLVLDEQEGVLDVLGDRRQRDRLAVLQLEHADLVAQRVVDVGALGERLERRQLDRQLLVGVGHRPDPGRDRDDDTGHQESTGGDHEPESGEPGQRTHSASRLPAPTPPFPSPVRTPGGRASLRSGWRRRSEAAEHLAASRARA